MARSEAYERGWLDAVLGGAGVDPGDLSERVRAGLEIGRHQYGDLAFMDRDNIAEATMETRDCLSYALMECQRLRANVAAGLVEASRAAAAEVELILAAQDVVRGDARFRRARQVLTS